MKHKKKVAFALVALAVGFFFLAPLMPADIPTLMHGITVYVSPSYELFCIGEISYGDNGYYHGFLFATQCQTEIMT